MIDLKLEPFNINGLELKRPFVIAGPCSAETEEQVLDTAREISKLGVKVLRAGIWKPRTRPNAFEGVGSEGLRWLRKVKQETGMYVGTEVANAKHVYECLKYGVDLLWLGARTTANPFAVQEIADALQGVDMPVLVKNPVNSDVELWIGALERINQAGITRLGAIHRGFTTYIKTKYRNHPQWQLPIELRRRIPNLPIITDPSHIAGNRDLIYDISQEALDLNFDGIIVETHINPDKALSDAKQQLNPQQLDELIKNLVLRRPKIDASTPRATLDGLRLTIDKLDHEVIEILSKRMKIAEDIGRYKLANNITILQSRRWDEVLKERIQIGEKMGLSSEFMDKLLRSIHQESINHQMEIMNKHKEEEGKEIK